MLKLQDVRSEMPNFERYKNDHRAGEILGIAVHHSATVHPSIGVPAGSALALFNHHVHDRGWTHGAYHYVIHANGLIEHALDECIEGFHAGFNDPEDALGLMHGQYWNRHYLAVCLLGWFDADRVINNDDKPVAVPNHFTHPTSQQMNALIALIQTLQARYKIPSSRVLGHRELAGCKTRCPGANVDLHALRAALRD
jgi:hypothetical protein